MLKLAVFAFTGVLALCLYAILLSVATSKRRADSGQDRAAQGHYDVFTRGNARKTFPGSSVAGTLAGAFFSLFFYWGAPFLLLRYGPFRTCIFIGIPFAGALALRALFDNEDPLAALLIQVPFRAAVGLWIKANDRRFQYDRLVQRGWIHVGCCRASASAEAIDIFFPATAKSGRWYAKFWCRRVPT